MSTKISSSTVYLLPAFLLTLTSVHAQSNNSQVLQNVKPNFYITTPQTGEQTAVGQTNQAQHQVESKSASTDGARTNSYTNKTAANKTTLKSSSRPKSQSTQAQAAAQYAAYVNAQNAQGSYASASAAYATQSAQPVNSWYGQTDSTVSTSANSAAQTTIQATYPSYVAHSAQERKGLLSRLLHKDSDPNANIVQVSNNAYRSSKLSGTSQAGMASWYGSDFHGGKTANGERYNMESMTAAHKSLPFGTMVKVRNERNGQECVVRINNRGPFTKGRILDVSKAAARQLGMIGSGVAKVSMQVIGRS